VGNRHRERGAALVETAVLLPVMVMLVFGLVEYSRVYSDAAKVSDATRAGARVGASMGRDPDYATAMAQATSSVLRELPAAAPQEIWIYRANAQGYAGADGTTSFTTCSANCIKYTWVPATQSFDTASPAGGGWAPSTHKICSVPFDQIGAYVKVTHTFTTSLFGNTRSLSDHSVFRFEPKDPSVCVGG